MVLMGKDINQQGPLALTMGHLSKMSEMGKVSRNLRVGVIEVRYPVSVFPLLSSPDSQGDLHQSWGSSCVEERPMVG